MPEDLPGTTTVIEAYLKGRALRERREDRQAELMLRAQQYAAQRELQEARAKQIDAGIKDATKTLEERRKYHEGLLAAKDKELEAARERDNLRSMGELVSLADALQKKFFEQIDPNKPILKNGRIDYDNLRYTGPGAAGNEKARVAGLVKGAEAGAEEPFKLNELREGQRARQTAQIGIDLNRQIFEQAQKDRDFAHAQQLQAAALASQEKRTQARIDATKGTDTADIQSELDRIKTGDYDRGYLRSLPSKTRKRVQLESNKRGYFIAEPKEKEKLDTVRNLNLYIDLNKQLHEKLGGMSITDAAKSVEVQQLKDKIDGLAKTFAVQIAQDRSVLSVKELPIIEKGVVQLAPGGFVRTGIAALEGKDIHALQQKENASRIKEFEEIYRGNLKGIIGNAPREQWGHLGKRYGFNMELIKSILPKPKNETEIQ